MKRALILNAGSSSIKWSVLDAQNEAVEDQGNTSWQESDPGRHTQELQALVRRLPSVGAVGHRVVHGGNTFHEAVLVNETVRATIASLAELAPLHNPAALAGIEAVAAVHPSLPQVAAFDTAFHHTMPDAAALYALPWDWLQRWGLRRFGFHGLSVQYAIRRTQELLGSLPDRMVVCHLGAGCSVTAVREGRSVDTSMGFTPLEGMMMAARSGTVDPGLLLHLLLQQRISASELDTALNERSGLSGISGIAPDLRQVLSAAETGTERAILAVEMFVHSLVRTTGAMIGVLGGLDALVCTGGIGEHSVPIRRRLAAACGYAGLILDNTANESDTGDRDIADPGSRARLLVVTAREDLTILGEMRRLLGE